MKNGTTTLELPETIMTFPAELSVSTLFNSDLTDAERETVADLVAVFGEPEEIALVYTREDDAEDS